jgi:hypothetical protein
LEFFKSKIISKNEKKLPQYGQKFTHHLIISFLKNDFINSLKPFTGKAFERNCRIQIFLAKYL